MIDLEWILWERKPYQTFFNYTPANGKSTCHIAASKKANYSLLTPTFFICFCPFQGHEHHFSNDDAVFFGNLFWDVSLNPTMPGLCTPSPIAIRISLIQLFPALDSLETDLQAPWRCVNWCTILCVFIFWAGFFVPLKDIPNQFLPYLTPKLLQTLDYHSRIAWKTWPAPSTLNPNADTSLVGGGGGRWQ